MEISQSGALALGTFRMGDDNIAIGRGAMLNPGEGAVFASGNIAVGLASMSSLTTGVSNVAIGESSLYGANTSSLGMTGSFNVAVGGFALYGLRNGDNNTAVGYNALAEIFSGYRNTAMGTDALTNTTTGFRNVAVGNAAGSKCHDWLRQHYSWHSQFRTTRGNRHDKNWKQDLPKEGLHCRNFGRENGIGYGKDRFHRRQWAAGNHQVFCAV